LTVVDSEERAVAVIELLAVKVIRLADADLTLARDEGEGFASVAEWRRDHERFWKDNVIPALPAGFTLTDDTGILAERFRLVSRV